MIAMADRWAARIGFWILLGVIFSVQVALVVSLLTSVLVTMAFMGLFGIIENLSGWVRTQSKTVR